jgi:hypothetical protein
MSDEGSETGITKQHLYVQNRHEAPECAVKSKICVGVNVWK